MNIVPAREIGTETTRPSLISTYQISATLSIRITYLDILLGEARPPRLESDDSPPLPFKGGEGQNRRGSMPRLFSGAQSAPRSEPTASRTNRNRVSAPRACRRPSRESAPSDGRASLCRTSPRRGRDGHNPKAGKHLRRLAERPCRPMHFARNPAQEGGQATVVGKDPYPFRNGGVTSRSSSGSGARARENQAKMGARYLRSEKAQSEGMPLHLNSVLKFRLCDHSAAMGNISAWGAY